jgi:hypothetical protein
VTTHPPSTVVLVSPCPSPDDLLTAFSVRQGHCFRMVYDREQQADHCRQAPEWKGIWRDVTGRSH